MSIVVSDLSERLDTLTKAVLSQPLARIGCSRVTIRPLSLRGKAFFQLEYQQGQKVTHRNVTKGELPGLFAQELDGLYLQAVLCTETETRQYIRKTNGSYKCTAKGEAQRTAIARALINTPAVLIADEPTAHLDTTLSREFMDSMGRLKARGTTILIASHDPLVRDAPVIDRIVEMRDGRLVAGGEQG